MGVWGVMVGLLRGPGALGSYVHVQGGGGGQIENERRGELGWVYLTAVSLARNLLCSAIGYRGYCRQGQVG